MTKMTKLQLRRLAHATTRDRSMTPVLHDALLEMYPKRYQDTIDLAEREARKHGESYIVFFNPRAMVNPPMRAGGRLHDYIGLFSIHGGAFSRYPNAPWHAIPEIISRTPLRKGSVLVYIAGLRRRGRR